MYIEMNPVLQLHNTFRNRWVGAYLSEKGIKVIPTVNWGLENTFDFCFNGIEKGSTVAVSTYMVSEHGNHKAQKEFFLKGYDEMLRKIEPEIVICYDEPFPEMGGNILYIDYELSSWRHYGDNEISPIKFMTGNIETTLYTYAKNFTGNIISETSKGGGSAYGGEWQPKKEEDKRFCGEPNTVKTTIVNNGDVYETKIGNDGRAVMERHNTAHNREHTGHTNPHDHVITWDEGHPSPGLPINSPDGIIPDFKKYQHKEQNMNLQVDKENNSANNSGNDTEVLEILTFSNYDSIADFKWSMTYGGELEFVWKDKGYTAFRTEDGFNIGEWCYRDDEGNYRYKRNGEIYENYEGIWVKTVDELLDVELDGDKLRNIVTDIAVQFRAL